MIINKKLNVENALTLKRSNNKEKSFKILLTKYLQNRNEFKTFFNLSDFFFDKKIVVFRLRHRFRNRNKNLKIRSLFVNFNHVVKISKNLNKIVRLFSIFKSILQ